MEIIWRYEENCYVIDYNRYIAREKDVIGEIVQMMKTSLMDEECYTGRYCRREEEIYEDI